MTSTVISPSQLKNLPIEYLHPGQYQPRHQFESKALKALSESIKRHGIIEPIVVRQSASASYEIIAGERRWRAAQLVQLSEVPCLIRQDSDETAALLALIENLQRVDLNAIEEASAYQQLLDTFGYSATDVADQVGKSRSEIANKLGLLQLDREVQQYITEGQLTAGHAKVLIGLSRALQLMLAKQAVAQGWSVRKMEQAVQRHKKSLLPDVEEGKIPCDPNLQALTQSLEAYLGLPVTLSPHSSSTSGYHLSFDFYDLDIFDGFLEKIGYKLVYRDA